MSEQDKPRRIIVPTTPRIQASRIETVPQLSTLLEDALSIYQTEILKFKIKVKSGKSLDLSEARVLQGYVKSLVDAAREMRERSAEADEKQADLTDEQLLEQTKVAMAGLEAKVEARKKLTGGQT